MDILCCALALLGSVVGAGFASGREIVRFFAAHGAMGFVAVAFSLAALAALFLCLAERLSASGVSLTMLARGLPVGGELDWLDDGTIAQALRARRPA